MYAWEVVLTTCVRSQKKFKTQSENGKGYFAANDAILGAKDEAHCVHICTTLVPFIPPST